LDLHIATVGQLLNSAVNTAKTIRDFAKESSDTTLKAEISSLYDTLLDIKAKVLDLDEENRSLKAQLVAKDEFEGPIAPHGYYYKKGDRQHPLCPNCIQEQPSKLGFMGEMEVTGSSHTAYRLCKLCRHLHYERR
jgi:hypothetical protein